MAVSSSDRLWTIAGFGGWAFLMFRSGRLALGGWCVCMLFIYAAYTNRIAEQGPDPRLKKEFWSAAIASFVLALSDESIIRVVIASALLAVLFFRVTWPWRLSALSSDADHG